MASPSFRSAWRTRVADAPCYSPDSTQEELGLLVQTVCEEVGDPDVRGHTWYVTTFEGGPFRVEKRVDPSAEALRLMCRSPSGESCEDLLGNHYLVAMDFIWDEKKVVRTVKFFVPRQAVDSVVPSGEPS